MLMFLRTLAASPRGFARGLSMPAQYPWTPDFKIFKSGISYTSSYKPASDKPSGSPIWVSTSGDDSSGNGSEALPYRSIARAGQDGSIIHIKSGFYADTHGDFEMGVTADTALIAVDGAGSVTITSSPDTLVWTLESGNVYRASVATSINDVIDLTHTRSGEYQLDGTSEVPLPYDEYSSITDVQNNAGSFYHDGSTLYVRTHDNRTPDSDVKPLWAKSIWSSSNVTHDVYLEGIEFWGQDALRINGDTSGNSARVVAVDCGFRFSPYGGNARCDAIADVRFIRCAVSDSNEDGFSYTNTSSGFSQNVLELNCSAYRCGRISDGDFNNNCSTSHNTCNVIRIGGTYDTSQGPVIADVSGSQAICYGVTARNANSSNGDAHVSDASFSSGTYGTNGEISKLWLYGCTASGSGFDRGVSGGGIIISDDVFSGIGNDSGTVISTNDDYTPIAFDDLTVWFDFDDDNSLEITGGGISEAFDKSPKRKNARQNTSGMRLPTPAVVSGRFNGRKVTTATSRHDQNSLDFLSTVTLGDLYIVTSYLDGAVSAFENYETMISGTGTNGYPRILAIAGTSTIAGGGFDISSSGVSINGAAASTDILPLGFSIVRATPISPITDTYTLFRHSINGSRGWTGDFAEVLVFETAKDSSEDAQIRAYLSKKWGIS
jgi:hypothetical protein